MGKDQLNVLSRCNVTYQINYRYCEANYIGQTKRQLKIRIKEHLIK